MPTRIAPVCVPINVVFVTRLTCGIFARLAHGISRDNVGTPLKHSLTARINSSEYPRTALVFMRRWRAAAMLRAAAALMAHGARYVAKANNQA